jgi:hypothetical protein
VRYGRQDEPARNAAQHEPADDREVGLTVTTDVPHHLLDGIEPELLDSIVDVVPGDPRRW